MDHTATATATSHAIQRNEYFAQIACASAQDALALEAAFRASAISFAHARELGASDLSIATMNRSRKKHVSHILQRFVYSAPSAVGYHRRTGELLLLPGALPGDLTAIEAQTLVKTAIDRRGAGRVDAVLASARSQAEAVAGLLALLASAAA